MAEAGKACRGLIKVRQGIRMRRADRSVPIRPTLRPRRSRPAMPMAAPGAAADVAGREGEEEPAVFDALEAEQRVGQRPHLGRPPAERDQLEAVVMADVDVED